MIHEIECERCKQSFFFHTTEDLINFELPRVCFECVQKVFFNPELGELYYQEQFSMRNLEIPKIAS